MEFYYKMDFRYFSTHPSAVFICICNPPSCSGFHLGLVQYITLSVLNYFICMENPLCILHF